MRYLIVLSFLLVSLGIGRAAHADECGDLAVKSDYARALVACRKAAETGDPAAQNDLGVMYQKGVGVTQDYAEAMKWYRKAATQGFADAQFNLGLMYHYGYGVPQSDVKALMLFKLAAVNGYDRSAKAQKFIATKMTAADIAQAERLARECAEKNNKGCGF